MPNKDKFMEVDAQDFAKAGCKIQQHHEATTILNREDTRYRSMHAKLTAKIQIDINSEVPLFYNCNSCPN